MSLFLQNVTLVELAPASVRPGCAIRCQDGIIVAAGPDLVPAEGDEVVDLGGQVVLPGLVVGHHHLYSALARGMPFPADGPTDFHDTLKKIWWRLDSALDAETVYCSGLAGGLDAVRCGITSIVDHHASPSWVEGSLDALGWALGEVGLRGLLCYEVSDRDGPEVARAGLEENRRFQAAHADHPLLRGMIGAHASFTIGDKTLDGLAALCADSGAGVHIHLLEDGVDRTISVAEYGTDPVTRLDRRGLLTPNALLSHGVRVTEPELERLKDAGVFLAHNARSNMNNRVGAAPVGRMGDRLVLGTDGLDGDILAEARTALFRGREHEPPVDGGRFVSMLTGAGRLLTEYFGVQIGTLGIGAAADLTILDYQAPTPMTADNLVGHVGFGWGAHLVRSVVVAGRFVYRDRQFTKIDVVAAAERTRAAATALWRKL